MSGHTNIYGLCPYVIGKGIDYECIEEQSIVAIVSCHHGDLGRRAAHELLHRRHRAIHHSHNGEPASDTEIEREEERETEIECGFVSDP